jgi:hypothetical protein
MKRELLRIEPMSAVRISFFLGLAAGFLFGLIEAILFKSLSASPAGSSLLPPEAQQMVTMSGAAIVLLAVVVGLVFSLIFAFAGALMAVFYNWLARMFGGLEFHLSGDVQRSADDEAAVDSSAEDEEHV